MINKKIVQWIALACAAVAAIVFWSVYFHRPGQSNPPDIHLTQSASVTLSQGSGKDVYALVAAQNADDSGAVWQSEDENIVRLEATGRRTDYALWTRLLAVSPGQTRVAVTNGGQTKYITVTVTPEVQTVQIPAESPQTVPPQNDPGDTASRDTQEEPDVQAHIVYVTPTGSRYHLSAFCAGKNAVPSTVENAVSDKKTPCQKCAK